MITSNFYRSVGVMFKTVSAAKVKNVSGNTKTCYHPGSTYLYNWYIGGSTNGSSLFYAPQVTSSNGGVWFGTGNTPPTFDDYKLSGTQVLGLAATKVLTLDEDDEGGGITGTYTLINNNASEVTISEVGLFAPIFTSANKIDTYQMWERTVLDNPVTIPAGGVGKVTYTVRANWPTA